MPGVLGVLGLPIIIFIIILVLIFIVSLLIGAWLIVKLVTGNRGERTERIDESSLIQGLHQGLTKMERRIESLETLLFEREKKGDRL